VLYEVESLSNRVIERRGTVFNDVCVFVGVHLRCRTAVAKYLDGSVTCSPQ